MGNVKANSMSWWSAGYWLALDNSFMGEFKVDTARRARIVAALTICTLALIGCDRQQSTTPPSHGVGASAAEPAAPKTAPLNAKNGIYELSDVIRAVMVDSDSGDISTLANGRNYNDFKAILSNIKRIEITDLPRGELPPLSFVSTASLFRGGVVLGARRT